MSNTTEKLVKDIRRCIRKKYSTEEKIRIVLVGLRGESINQNVYHRWSKEFLEAGKQRLAGNTKREATSDEVTELRKEDDQLEHLLAELILKSNVLKSECAWPGCDVGQRMTLSTA